MKTIWFLPLIVLYFGLFSIGCSKSISTRPAVVNIGALFTFDSTIGRVAKIAIEEAVKDVNSNSSILYGTKLSITMQNSNCNAFLGMVEALRFMETDIVAVIGPQCSTVAHIISYVANELQVPLLSFGVTDPALSSLQFPFFVRTTQSDLYQMTAVAEMVFSVAKYLGLMGNGYVWIATDWLAYMLDSASLSSETKETMQGVLVLRQHIPESDRKRAFLSRWRNLTGWEDIIF